RMNTRAPARMSGGKTTAIRTASHPTMATRAARPTKAQATAPARRIDSVAPTRSIPRRLTPLASPPEEVEGPAAGLHRRLLDQRLRPGPGLPLLPDALHQGQHEDIVGELGPDPAVDLTGHHRPVGHTLGLGPLADAPGDLAVQAGGIEPTFAGDPQ